MLFSTAVNAEVIAKPVILVISFLTSFIFVLRIVFVAKLLILRVLFYYIHFFLTTLFLTL